MTSKISVLSLFALLSAFSATPALAAKFKPIPAMASTAARELATTVKLIAANKTTFGDHGQAAAFSFTRKATEADLNTMKQLNFAKAGLNSDDSGAEDMQTLSSEALARYLLSFNSQPDDLKAFDEAQAALIQAFAQVKKDPDLRLYGTHHADEDGSWQVINVLDVKKSQVLLIQLGYSGT